MTLERVQDLVSGYKQMLAYVVEDLAQKKHRNEAFGICQRNGLESHVRSDVRALLEGWKYDEAADKSLSKQESAFGPVSKPEGDYMRLPDTVKVEWVGTESDVAKLEALLSEPLIGVDSEWRAELTQYHRTRPSLFQISGERSCFLIDLMALQQCKPLDEMLGRVFSNEKSTIIGFAFDSDVAMFARKHPHFTFIKYIAHFIDAQSYYGEVCSVESQTGLAKVALQMLGKSICKNEQVSDWERRPLRPSQRHYGALDAYILIGIYKALAKTSKEIGGPPIESAVVELDNRDMVLADLEDDPDLFADGDFYEKETQRRSKLADEKIEVASPAVAKHQSFEQGKFKKLVTSKGLTPDSVKTLSGFMVDKNLSKLAKKLQEKGIDCVDPTDTQDSEKICGRAIAENRIFITSNLRLFNKKGAMPRCCVHYKDSPEWQYRALNDFFGFEAKKAKMPLKFVLDDFAARQFNKEKAGLGFIDFPQAEFGAKIQDAYDKDATVTIHDGYAPFCKHVFVRNFTPALPTFVRITDENRPFLRSGYQARRANELPVLCRWFDFAEMPEGSVKKAAYLDIILYSKE
jgi:hypothetical protein